MKRNRRSPATPSVGKISPVVLDRTQDLLRAFENFQQVWRIAIREAHTMKEAEALLQYAEADVEQKLREFETALLAESERE